MLAPTQSIPQVNPMHETTSLIPLSPDEVFVTWEHEVPDDGSAPVAAYYINVEPAPQGWEGSVRKAAGETLLCVIMGLEAGEEYRIEVLAENGSGTSEGSSCAYTHGGPSGDSQEAVSGGRDGSSSITTVDAHANVSYAYESILHSGDVNNGRMQPALKSIPL